MQAAAALHTPMQPTTSQDLVWMQAATQVLLAVVVLGVLMAGLVRMGRLPIFQIQKVQLEGDLQRNNLATVRANVVSRLQDGFFHVDLGHSREVFEAIPWVRKAVVRRVWPNELRVRLEEHQPAAYWHHEDRENELVNVQGEIFDANLGDVEDERLPTLDAPTHATAEDAVRMLEMLRKLKPALVTLGDIDALKLTERGSWSVTLDSDARIELGRGTPDEVLARVDRFVRTLPELHRKYPAQLSYADLRYPEGYAVKLRGLTTLIDPLLTPAPGVKPAAPANTTNR
jgi:cell division protein FtsQ